MITLIVLAALVAAVLLLGSSVRLVQQYEKGIVLRFGRLLPAIREPGLRLIVPFADPVELLRFFDRANGTDTRAAVATETPTEIPNGRQPELDAAAFAAMTAPHQLPVPEPV